MQEETGSSCEHVMAGQLSYDLAGGSVAMKPCLFLNKGHTI